MQWVHSILSLQPDILTRSRRSEVEAAKRNSDAKFEQICIHFLRQVRDQARYVYQAIDVFVNGLTWYRIDIEAEVAEKYKVAHSRQVGVTTASVPVPPKPIPPFEIAPDEKGNGFFENKLAHVLQLRAYSTPQVLGFH